MTRLSQLVVLLGAASFTLAGTIQPITPFAIDGALENCNPGPDDNSGGTITVNGFTVTVPKNLIAQFPVAWVPFRKMCLEADAQGYEISVFGNVVNGVPIAGQINVAAPFFLEGAQGYIESVTTGSNPFLKIKGGPTIRINDPNAVFTAGLQRRQLFLVDDENPSVTAFSGFPMCIPRNDTDPLCPASNRPQGQTNFELTGEAASTMAPLLPGDFIQYSGLKDDGEILAWSITAINVQITTTASDTVPNYIRIEDALIGVWDNAANVELADIRFIGYLSSCTGATITVFAIDVDPCTGAETYRQVGTTVPKAGDPRCKWEYRADTTQQSTYTREYLIKTNAKVIETKSGIKAGQYVQPVTEWIQPEVNVPGTEPPPFRFRDIRGLVEGDFLDNQQFGPLDPFPGPAPPPPSKTCSPDDIPSDPTSTAVPSGTPAPVVDPIASVGQITAVQRVGAEVILTASNTAQSIPSDDLAFNWTQTSPSSPAQSIQNSAQPTVTFIAKQGTDIAPVVFTFEVKVTLKSNSSSFSTAHVNVTVSPTAEDIVALDTYTWESRQSGTISVTCHSNVVNGDSKGMDLWLNGGNTKLKMLSGSGPGKWLYQARSTNRPTNVQCVSGLGGKSAVVTATTSRRRRGELGLDVL